jgi:hypothetical protein
MAELSTESYRLPTKEEIEAKHQRAAETEIRRLPSKDASQNLRLLKVCDFCSRYRWNGVWKSGILPSGFFPIDGLAVECPDCERKREKADSKKLPAMNSESE